MMDEPRKRGTGSVFQRGDRWWVKFYQNGRPQRESASVQRRNGIPEPAHTVEEAERYLAARLKEVHASEVTGSSFTTQKQRRKTIDDLLTALERDFRIRGKDSQPTRSHIKRAKSDFGHFRATALTDDDVLTYIDNRLNPTDGVRPSAKASINRVLEILSQAYTLGKLPAPEIRFLSEKGNERKGFFSEREIRAVIANLPADLADYTLYGWITGWRSGEISALSWDDVGADGVIRLAALDAKEREARSIPLEGELAELFERRQAARRVEANGTVKLSSFVFHIEGQPIGDFRKPWARACCSAGVGTLVCPECRTDVSEKGKCARCGESWTREELSYVGRLFHDLRRSACRNMVNAGVPQKVAMTISGHKTDSMFRRYAITDENDKREALRRTQEHSRRTRDDNGVIPMSSGKFSDPVQSRAQVGHNSGPARKRVSRSGSGSD